MTSPSPDDRWAEIEKAVEIAQNSPRFVVTPEYPCLLELRAEIQHLKVALLRLANATANQLPDRTQFFADLASSDAHIPPTLP
ncbi:hypothetical protein EBT31_13320 [bacterium]|jgi:hypothetical protein|nr:hypothetical protein [bacterium]